MNWIVFFWHKQGLIIIGQYNNYDLESGYMEYSITANIRKMFPEAKLHRDEAGMVDMIGQTYPVYIESM